VTKFIDIDFDPTNYRQLGIAFNPKRAQYSDFRNLWNSNEFEETVAESFIELWETQGHGEWPKLSEKYYKRKLRKGIPNNVLGMTAGAMMVATGNMYMGVIAETPESFRSRKPLEMRWGLDLGAAAFQVQGGSYPEYAHAARPITGISQENNEKISDVIREYVVDLFENSFGGRIVI